MEPQSERPLVPLLIEDNAMMVENIRDNLRSKASLHHMKLQSRPRFVISYKNPYILKWNLLIIFLACYNGLALPFWVAFKNSALRNPGVIFIDVLIDIFFALDIVINFRTSYFDIKSSEEVANLKMIAKRYICKGTFVLDFLTIFPFDYFARGAGRDADPAALFGMLKLVRLLRIGDLIANLKSKESTKLILRFFQLVLYLLLYTHIVGCFWFLIVDQNQEWIPGTDFIKYKTEIYTAEITQQYFYSIYSGLFMIVGIEINPRDGNQYLFCGIMNVIGALITGLMLGQMAIIMTNLYRSERKFSEISDAINTTMKNMKLPTELQIKVSEFLINTFHILEKQTEYEAFLSNLRPSLQHQVNAVVFHSVIQSNPLIKHLPSDFFVSHLESKFYQPDAEIVTQFEKGTEMYFIASGYCEVEVLDERKNYHRVRLLKESDHFGELGLLYHTYRTATVRTITYTSCASINERSFREIVANYPGAKNFLVECVSQYKDPWKKFLRNVLSRIDYLHSITQIELDQLMYSMTQESREVGSCVYQPGETVNKIYIITEGKVRANYSFFDKSLANYFRSAHMNSSPNSPWNPSDRMAYYQGRKSTEVILTLEVLGKGSIIGAHHALIEETNLIDYRVVEPVVLLAISVPELDKISSINSSLKSDIETAKSEMYIYDKFRKENVKKNIPLDYIRYFKEGSKHNSKSWRKFRLFKNEVLRIIVQHRVWKQKGVPNVKMLVEILKATLKAEEKGKDELAKLIATGVVPPEAVEGADLLTAKEAYNPLLTQFAARAMESKRVFDFLINNLRSLSERLMELQDEKSRYLDEGLDFSIGICGEMMVFLNK